ncbi:MAG TPA: hypothetical protein VGU46_09365 [Acidobacteriaceae bacterium]|nr:hypothetical protein [Acidobacteriaceae bacterium]
MAIHDRQRQYWEEMVKLKAANLYICSYRDYLGHWVTTVATIRAIASSLSIAGWAIWHNLSFIWASIIAASQVADALKDVFPIAKKNKAASDLSGVLENLFIDAQLEWDSIFSGKYTDDQISTRLHKLRSLRLQAEHRNFPGGLSVRSKLQAQARTGATIYFQETYGVE